MFAGGVIREQFERGMLNNPTYRRQSCPMLGLLLATLVAPCGLRAESGYDAWLRYAAIDNDARRQRYDTMPGVVVAFGDSVVARTAQQELIRGVRGMLGKTLRAETHLAGESAIVLGTVGAVKEAVPTIGLGADLREDCYWLETTTVNGFPCLIITGRNERGVLYGAFALLRKVALHERVDSIDETQNPYAPVRWTKEWDNLDGSIERGYAGSSIFFEANNVVADLSRVRDYARLLASIGVNGCTVNNVNANPRVITTEFLPQLSRIADAFRPWGIRASVSIDFGSPRP